MSEYMAMRAIVSNLRKRGGQGVLHAEYFPKMTYSEYLAAISQLRRAGAIVYLGACTYELGYDLRRGRE